MAEAKPNALPFAAEALHTNALATSKHVAPVESGAYYYGLQQSILEIGREVLRPGCRVVDLRCDLETFMPLLMEHEDLCRFVALSPDDEGAWRCFDRLRTRVKLGFVDAARLDLSERFPEVLARMMLSLNALDELNGKRRLEVLESMHRHLERGGALIVMEPVEGAEPDLRPRRRRWSPAEWESVFKAIGFRTVSRIWSDEGRVAWRLGK